MIRFLRRLRNRRPAALTDPAGRPYRLVLWDFDGTLADSLECALGIYNGMAARHGFRAIDDRESVRGLTARGFIKHHRIPVLRIPRLIKEYLAIQKGQMEDIRLYEGMADVVRALRAGQIRQGIISSNDRDNITACLGVNGAAELFDFVVGYPRLFGKARAIARVLRREKVPRSQVLYVGDEIRDIEAARRARIAVASVTWGFNTEESLRVHRPDFVFHEPAGLLRQLLPGPGRADERLPGESG